MLLDQVDELQANSTPLRLADIPIPEPIAKEILVKVTVCGVCHTELDEIEGRTAPSQFPMTPGHQVIGKVTKLGTGVTKHKIGDRVGIAWISSACGICDHCKNGSENLCDEFQATGRDAHGGYADFMTIHENYAYPIPNFYKDEEAAPLLCAGAVGYRSLKLTNLHDGGKLGLTGFGASAHLVLKLVKYIYPNTGIYVFARKADKRQFAMDLGANWSGDTAEASPVQLDAIIDTTPAWKPVVEAMNSLKKGGRLVINAIRKEENDKDYLQELSYQDHLWLEKEIKSVANVTSGDVKDFLDLAAKAQIVPLIKKYKLEEANEALLDIKFKKIKGAKVLLVDR